MKKILTILILLSFCFIAKSQYVVPRGYPIKNMSYYNFAAPGGFVLIDSLIMTRSHDTTMKPLYPSLMYWQNTGVDSAWWQWDMVRWSKIGSGGGSGGVTTFFALTDVDSSGIQDGYIPYYDATSGNILFEAQGTSPIASGTTTYQVQDSTNTPPVSFPSGFDTTYWMVGGAGTGIFSGNNYKIALYINGVFDSFITPTVNDWAITLDDVIYHQYDGATWPRRTPPLWSTTLNLGGGFLGSSDNTNVFFRRRNINQIIFQNNGVRFPQLTGASDGLMGINTVGLSSNVQIGSGLLLSGGTLSSTVSGGLTTADNGLTANTATNVRLGGALVANTTVSGAFTMSFTTDRVIINVGDSIQLAASNDIGITSLGTLRNTAATITSKAATATFGSNTKSIFHYETGVGDSIALELKSTGARWVGINTFSTSTTAYKPLQQDTVTGFMIRKLIDVSSSSQITGTMVVANGGTGLATLTANSLLVGNGTGNVTFIAPGTSGNVLTSNGTTWVSTAASTNYWTRGQYGALASTNILQPITLTDTFAVGSGGANLRGKNNFFGNAYFQNSVSIGGAINATYELNVNGDIRSTNTLEVDGLSSYNTFGAAIAGQAMTVGIQNTANGGGIFIGTNQIGVSGMVYGIRMTPTVNQTVTTSGVGVTGVQVQFVQSNTATPVSATWTSFDAAPLISSTNATNIVVYNGFKTSVVHILGTQKFTTYNAFHDTGYVSTSGTTQIATGDYYSFRADSVWGTRVGGVIRPLSIQDNSAKTEQVRIEPKTAFGDFTTAPTAYVMIGAGTTANSQLRFIAGVAPTSPNDGDHWYEDTNDRLMFRQNATDIEILGVSAVSNVSPTAQNRTLTISYNGTTYYISAKTTND